MQCRGIRPHLEEGKSHGFSQVAAGTWGTFSSYSGDGISAMSGLPYTYVRHLRNLHDAWQGNKDASRSEAGNRDSLSSFHSDIGIPIDFQEESGIVTF